MKRIAWSVACLAMGFSFIASASEVEVKNITDLHRMEAYRGHLFHSNMLLVGKRALDGEPHRIEFFSGDDQSLLHTLTIPHTVGQIWNFDEESVGIVGKLSNPWRTFFTIVDLSRKEPRVKKTYRIPEKYQIDKFAQVDGTLFFNDRGSRSIIKKTFFSYKKISLEISGPDDMVGTDSHLWIIEGRGIGDGDESLVKYDPNTDTFERILLLDLGARGISSITYAKDQNLIIIDDGVGGRIIAIDATSNEVVSTLEIGKDIRSLDIFGSCVAAMRTSAKEIVFAKIDAGRSLAALDTWSTAEGGEKLRNPLDIAVDPARGITYVRGIDPCIFCDPSVTYGSVAAIIPTNDDVSLACQE